jgi:hypothetical protein
VNNEKQELELLREVVEAYLKNCAPIHWLNWASKCPDPDAKKLLDSVLFIGGCLRDLTDASVKAEVLEVISQSPAIMELVIADFAEELRMHTEEAPASQSES